MEPRKFMSIASKPHAKIAGEMAAKICDVIYEYADKVPLSLVVGVLRIVEHEMIERNK